MNHSIKHSPSYINTYYKMHSLEKSKSVQLENDNVIDQCPDLSRQTSVRKRKDSPRKYIVEMKEFYPGVKENVKQHKSEDISSINNEDESKNNKQTDENTEDKGCGSFRQTRASCSKNSKIISRKYTAKVNESNADLEDNVKWPRIEWVGSIYDKKWICKYCNKIFSSLHNFVDHVNRVEKRYICHLCFDVLSRRDALNSHLKSPHGGEKNYICNICKKSFAEKNDMKIHRREHIGEGLYLCKNKKCNKSFQSRQAMYYHIMTHTNEYPYECIDGSCDKKFRTKQQMSIHMTVHTREKNYKCVFCPKRFSQKSNMQTHMMMHSGEKKYKCNQCKESFRTSSKLRTHKKVHSKERPYTCECGDSFKRKQHLERHKRSRKCKSSQESSRVKFDSK